MKCLNTRGACENEARYVKEINCSNFCSFECYLLYWGYKKPKPKRKKFDNPERQKDHDLYIWALGGERPEWMEVKIRRPPPEEWIATIPGGATYLWDDFSKRYVQYGLGMGIYDDSGKLIAREDSNYYRAVIKRINDVQFNPKLLTVKTVDKPTMKRGVKKGTKRGPYKKTSKNQYTFVCKGCKRTFTMKSSKRQQFHSEACRRAYWRRKKRQKDADEARKRRY